MDPKMAAGNAILARDLDENEARYYRAELRRWILRGGYRPVWSEVLHGVVFVDEADPMYHAFLNTKFVLSIKRMCSV